MVNTIEQAAIKLFIVLFLTCPLASQTDSERDRRLAELERKVRLLDPSYIAAPEADFDQRLANLEQSVNRLLSAQRTEAEAAKPIERTANPERPLQPLSVTGDYSKSEEGETRLPVAGYMEAHFNKDEGRPGRGDFHRFVLLFGHSFSERIKFWSEFELEHALVEGGEEDKGEVALEQAYLDFLIKPWLNLRGGMLLSPVGLINERHEPPSFNGVERPFVETLIIPTTWRELGAGLTGDLGHGIRYRGYLMSALDPSRFSADEGIRGGATSGFNAPFRNPAFAARVEHSGIRRLAIGLSGYTGVSSTDLIRVTPRVSILSVDGRYSFARFDVRSLFAKSWISRTAQLNSQIERLTGFNPNVAKQLMGWYIEPAVHVFPRRLRNDVIVFTRYEKYDTQHRMAAGYVPLPGFNRSSIITGLTVKPNADVALKFDYVINRNASSVVRPISGLNLGLGWWF